MIVFFFFKQKTAYEMRISDWSSDVCSSDLAWKARASGIAVSSPQEALVLASVVEKETGVATERRMVAGLYSNRLKIGMRLQADPTIIYPQIGRASCRERVCQYV